MRLPPERLLQTNTGVKPMSFEVQQFPLDQNVPGGVRRGGIEAGRALRARGGQLSRLVAATVEHRRHQAENIRRQTAIVAGSHLGSALLVQLIAQEADVVFSCFTLLRGHVGSLRNPLIR
jgi:hypothetical protein